MNLKPVTGWIDRLRDNILPLVIMWALGQSLAGIWWAATLQGRITAAELANQQQADRLTDLDARGTRQLAIVIERQNRNTALIDQQVGTSGAILKMQGQIDVVNVDIRRLGEQQMRIISALDNMYSELQQFVRGHPNPQAPPFNLPSPK